jgi:hypothetical protein
MARLSLEGEMSKLSGIELKRARLVPSSVFASPDEVLQAGARQMMNHRGPEFAAVLRTATGVWLPGGRQWRLTDAYLDTRTHRELEALLERGGVIGGTSAGASVQASFMVRGAPEGNHIVIAPGRTRGFGFLRNAAVDQHLLFNASHKARPFSVPRPEQGQAWHRVIDTAHAEQPKGALRAGTRYPLRERTLAVLRLQKIE